MTVRWPSLLFASNETKFDIRLFHAQVRSLCIVNARNPIESLLLVQLLGNSTNFNESNKAIDSNHTQFKMHARTLSHTEPAIVPASIDVDPLHPINWMKAKEISTDQIAMVAIPLECPVWTQCGPREVPVPKSQSKSSLQWTSPRQLDGKRLSQRNKIERKKFSVLVGPNILMDQQLLLPVGLYLANAAD